MSWRRDRCFVGKSLQHPLPEQVHTLVENSIARKRIIDQVKKKTPPPMRRLRWLGLGRSAEAPAARRAPRPRVTGDLPVDELLRQTQRTAGGSARRSEVECDRLEAPAEWPVSEAMDDTGETVAPRRRWASSESSLSSSLPLHLSSEPCDDSRCRRRSVLSKSQADREGAMARKKTMKTRRSHYGAALRLAVSSMAR